MSILCLSGCLGACLSVCPCDSNKRQNSWTDRIQKKFWVLTWPQGRFMDDRIFENLPLTTIFIKFSQNFYEIREHIFLFCFTVYTKRTCSQLKKKMGAKCPKRLVSLCKLYRYYRLFAVYFVKQIFYSNKFWIKIKFMFAMKYLCLMFWHQTTRQNLSLNGDHLKLRQQFI